MLKSIKNLIAISVAVLSATTVSAADFIDFGPAKRLLEIDVHVNAGGSTITQNYKKCFPQIRDMNVNTGLNLGVGARAVFGLRGWLGFGTAVDVSLNNYNFDLTVLDAENSSMSAVYVDNRTYRLNFPVFMSFRFNVDRNVRWNVDAGLYYSYGFGGRQKQRIYRAEINELEELVAQHITVKTDYYHSAATFVNSFNRGDIGLHIGTSLNFGPHLYVGGQFQFGFKNAARPNGVVNPNIHNIDLHASLGYRF